MSSGENHEAMKVHQNIVNANGVSKNMEMEILSFVPHSADAIITVRKHALTVKLSLLELPLDLCM